MLPLKFFLIYSLPTDPFDTIPYPCFLEFQIYFYCDESHVASGMKLTSPILTTEPWDFQLFILLEILCPYQETKID